MKNSFKIAVQAAVVIFTILSCSSCGNKDQNTEGSKIDTTDKTIVTPQKTIDTSKKAGADTTRKDTVKK
jgi:hypothetical protein